MGVILSQGRKWVKTRKLRSLVLVLVLEIPGFSWWLMVTYSSGSYKYRITIIDYLNHICISRKEIYITSTVSNVLKWLKCLIIHAFCINVECITARIR